MLRLGFLLVVFLSFGVAAYALVAYALFPVGAAVHPDMRASFGEHKLALHAHVFGSAVALLVGPLQFSAYPRNNRPHIHRWLGRLYLSAGVALGGLAGLFLSASAYGGLPSKLGFACLALAWLYTGSHAFGAARARNFIAHRRWMVRNFSLAFAAVTLRLWLPGSVVLGVPFEVAYPIVAWLCWVPNLVVAELIVRRGAPSSTSVP
jgi:uncharacterized membrane protein